VDREELIEMLALLSHGPWTQERDTLALGMLLGFLAREGYGDVMRAFLACTQLSREEQADADV